jgi:hypothetical protein
MFYRVCECKFSIWVGGCGNGVVKDMVCVREGWHLRGARVIIEAQKKTSIANPVEDCYACFGDCLHYIECMRGKL